MTIQNFIEELKNDKTIDLENKLKVRTYIPIAEKRAIIEDIIDRSVVIENDAIQCDYINKKIAFELAMIKYHTNCDLEIDVTSSDDYDAIETVLVDGISFRKLATSLYREDYYECEMILDKMIEDLYSQYSVEASVAKMTSFISESIGNLTSSILKKIESLDINNMLPKDADLSRITTFLEKYGR